MRRQSLPSTRGGRSLSINNANSTRVSRTQLSSSSPSPNRNPSTIIRTVAARRTNPRLNTLSSIIMTKAQQQRRRAALLSHPSNIIGSIEEALEGDSSRNFTFIGRTNISGPTRVQTRRRLIVESNNDSAGEDDSPSGTHPRFVRVARRFLPRNPLERSQLLQNGDISAMLLAKKAKNRVTFDMDLHANGNDSVIRVLTSEKILPRILRLMNWNELLPLRGVCRTWFEIIESHPKISSQLGIIVLRSSVDSKMATFNSSSVTWTKFRFIGPVIFDMTRPVQNEFWNKHGPLMTHLDIQNRAMSLTALVEILARCPKLEFFKCNWTPEMYSFNSDLIKKYYGIHFNNGTFAKLQTLIIDNSSSLTDSALWSILKWCGGSIKSLKLTSNPDEDLLNRLKPRWSTESIKNYFDRFGYTGNLQYLDLSWTNLVNDDMRSICAITTNLKGITLNHCKLDDDVLKKLLQRHGEFLDTFKIEGTSFTETIFGKAVLPKVKVLHIGGLKGSVKSLSFLKDMPCLEDFSCRNTQWLDQSMLLKPLNSISKQKKMKIIDFSGALKYAGNKNLDPNLNRTWFSDFTGLLGNVTELNLGKWSSFGTDQNFKNICETLPLLEKLNVGDWVQLTDVGTTGLLEEDVHQDWGTKPPNRPRAFVGQLEGLKYLDLSGTSITDATMFLALYALKNLRNLCLDNTRITDNGLKGIISKIQSLDRISVTKCPRITLSQPRFRRTDGRMVFFGKLA